MGLFGKDPLKDGETKHVSLNGKRVRQVRKVKGKNEYEILDAKGKKIKSIKGRNERVATDAARKDAEREAKKAGGGGIKGGSVLDSNRAKNARDGRQGGGGGGKKSPGSGQNSWLWKDVKKNGDK